MQLAYSISLLAFHFHTGLHDGLATNQTANIV